MGEGTAHKVFQIMTPSMTTGVGLGAPAALSIAARDELCPGIALLIRGTTAFRLQRTSRIFPAMRTHLSQSSDETHVE